MVIDVFDPPALRGCEKGQEEPISTGALLPDLHSAWRDNQHILASYIDELSSLAEKTKKSGKRSHQKRHWRAACNRSSAANLSITMPRWC